MIYEKGGGKTDRKWKVKKQSAGVGSVYSLRMYAATQESVLNYTVYMQCTG